MRQVQAVGSRVFVDTNAFGALAVDGDAHHLEAKSIATLLAASRVRLVTTNYVVAETHALILAWAGREPALLMLHRIDQSMERIVWVSKEDVDRARAIVEKYNDKNFSLTDATSFVVMEQLRLSRVFTVDRHFAQYGFELAATS